MADKGEGEGPLGLLPCQSAGCGKESFQVFSLREVLSFGHDLAGNLSEFLAIREIMFEDHELAFQFRWDLDHGGHDQPEAAELFSLLNPLEEGLDDLDRLEEAVEVEEDVEIGIGLEGRWFMEGRQGIEVLARPLSLPALVDVPDGELPAFFTSQGSQLPQDLFGFAADDPQSGKTRPDVFP